MSPVYEPFTAKDLVLERATLVPATGNFARPEWFPEPNWNKITENNRQLDTAA
jgi:hypothetical protein